jgi:hypothetical protein
MVTVMKWTYSDKYKNHKEFQKWFTNEQDYVDAMFVQIVMFNFGVNVRKEKLLRKDT